MSKSKWVVACFSPTGTTRKIAYAVMSGMGEPVSEMDLCKECQGISFDDSMALLVVVPVYGGRVPKVAIERLAVLRGNGQKAVAVVVYGNREYDDALLELKNELEKSGFQVIAAGAFIAEHSIIRSIANGRPDEEDIKIAHQFGMNITAKMLGGDNVDSVQVPGKDPYVPIKPSAFHPTASETCVKCGHCAELCPVSAIPVDTPNQTLDDRCINCMRCVQVCPVQARSLPSAFLAGAKKMLEEKASGYKKPELFL